MVTNQPKALALAAKAWDLCERGEWLAAITKYEEAAKFINPSHSRSQDIFGEFAMALGKAGRTDEATIQLRKALDSAELVDGPRCVGANVARYFLADNLLRRNQLSEARGVVGEWPNVEFEGKWLMNYMAATICYAAGDRAGMLEQASIALRDGPAGKWSSIDEIEELITQELCS